MTYLCLTDSIEQGESPEQFGQQLTPKPQEDDFDPFAQLAMRQWPSLFSSDFSYVSSALEAITQADELQINQVPEHELIELTMPQELRQRYSRLPQDIVPASDQPLILCADKGAIATALEEARRSEDSWPAIQYLWELHPVLEWLSDRCMTTFGRHQAPVITLPQGLGGQETVFVMAGVIPNRRGQPLINRWLSVVFQQGQFQRVEDFEQTLARTHLGKQSIPNQGQPVDEALLELRGVAVDQATKAILEERQTFMKQLEPQPEQQRQRLEALRGNHYEQLELRFGDDARPAAFVQARKEWEKSRIERIFEDQRRWVEESITTEPAPYIKIIAVLRGDGG